jgi:hypothetical protein
VTGSCEHGNEPPGSIRGEELLEQQSDKQLLKKGSDLWSHSGCYGTRKIITVFPEVRHWNVGRVS